MRHISTVVDALKCLDKVIVAVMSVSLGATWAETIESFGAAHATVTKVLHAAKPYRAHRSEARLTPKMKCLLEEVPLWIARHGCSLLRISEQSFESLHHDYILFSANFKIKRSGAAVSSHYRQKPDSVGHALDLVHTPSDGTRSGSSKARKRKRNDTVTTTAVSSGTPAKKTKQRRGRPPIADPSQPENSGAPEIVGVKFTAQTQRLRCLLAFNLRKLPVDSVSQDRVHVAVAWLEGGSRGDHPGCRHSGYETVTGG